MIKRLQINSKNESLLAKRWTDQSQSFLGRGKTLVVHQGCCNFGLAACSLVKYVRSLGFESITVIKIVNKNGKFKMLPLEYFTL